MLQEERLTKIIEYMKEKKSARLTELSSYIGVSENTIRKDLAELSSREILSVVRGGAVWGKSDITKSISAARETINKHEKEELVTCLGNVIENGQAIALNGGTTSIEAARYLGKFYNRMTVITNSMDVVDILKEKKNFKIIMAGGVYDKDENTVGGASAEEAIDLYNTDYAIIAVNGISLEKGITDFREKEAELIKVMIANTKKSIVCADHSKFERVSYINVCPLSGIDYFMTDSDIDKDVLAKYRDRGVNVIIPQ